MVEIKQITDICPMTGLFNSIASEDGILYKPMNTDEFNRTFIGEGRIVISAYEDDALIGFACGTADSGRGVGYISYIGVKPEYRHGGIGKTLLSALERKLAEYDNVTKYETVFYNPVHLTWFIPGGGGDDHPCAPGTEITSEMYMLLLSNGYTEWTRQNSYYLKLAGYSDPPALAEIRKGLLDSGIEITLYNSEIHQGLAELFDNIANPGWKSQVMKNTDKPIIVAVDHNNGELVVAYTGPLTTDISGRGNFCGIGTRREYRGRGIGKVVFCEMCRRHAERGATFMSLYTGDTNPARYIYEAAGFHIVRSWGNLRKVIL